MEQVRDDNKSAVKKYRAKKQLIDPDFAKKESKRIENIRKKRVNSLSDDQKADYKRKAAERKRRSRENKKKDEAAARQLFGDSVPSTSTPFRRPQTYGRALNRSLRNLPKSPGKSTLVVAGLARHVGLKLNEKMKKTGIGGKEQLSETTKLAVEKFYFRPDVSYTMPGMTDEMTVWKDGKKIKYRKYYLTLFLREAHHKIGSSSNC